MKQMCREATHVVQMNPFNKNKRFVLFLAGILFISVGLKFIDGFDDGRPDDDPPRLTTRDSIRLFCTFSSIFPSPIVWQGGFLDEKICASV